MKLPYCLIVVLAVSPALADDTEKELKKLVGTWDTVSQKEDGKDKAADEFKNSIVKIDANGKWEALKDGAVFLKGSVKLDTSKKPLAADWSIEGIDMVAKGIVEVDGDTWKHCFSFKERPTEFGSKEGSEVIYIVLKRVKK
jgi:uncharacterized protein (TIGR03067 family)